MNNDFTTAAFVRFFFFLLHDKGSLPPSPADSGVSDVDSSSSGHGSNDELRARLQPYSHLHPHHHPHHHQSKYFTVIVALELVCRLREGKTQKGKFSYVSLNDLLFLHPF